MNACRGEGYQIAVAVVDRFGVTQVLLRDQLAGAHTPETATRKAWTAASFKTDTKAMMDETQPGKPQSGARFVPGAPGGEHDQQCAAKGIEAIEESLML